MWAPLTTRHTLQYYGTCTVMSHTTQSDMKYEIFTAALTKIQVC